MGDLICGEWCDICLLWAKAYWDPQESIWSARRVCLCTSSHFVFFVLSVTPPSHRQAGGGFFFSLKHVHLHFKHVKEMASVSAAVTVFGRQAGDVCLCDTDKIYLAADTTVQRVLQGTVARMGVTESQKQSESNLNSDKWDVGDHFLDIFCHTFAETVTQQKHIQICYCNADILMLIL